MPSSFGGGALRGAIGLALALVVYSAHLEYKFGDLDAPIEFADGEKIGKKSSFIKDGGQGYGPETTAVLLCDANEAKRIDSALMKAKSDIDRDYLFVFSHRNPSLLQLLGKDGKILSLSQSPKQLHSTFGEIKKKTGMGMS